MFGSLCVPKKRFTTLQTTKEKNRRPTDLYAWTVVLQPKRGLSNLSERRKQSRSLRPTFLVSRSEFPPLWWRRLGGAIVLSAGLFTGIWAQSTPGTRPAVAQVSTCAETSGPVAELGPAPWETLTFPALPPLPTLEPLYEETFKNGLHLLILEDHQVPLVNGFLLSEVGSWLDPPEKIGLADTAAALLREGGSIAHSATDLDEFLANRAASIETSSGVKSFQIAFQSEPSDLESVLRAMASLVRAPLFPATKLELVKQRQHASIARRNDEPGLVLRRAFSKLIYGKDSPFAREPTDETIDHVQREDLVRFHAENFGPDSNTFLVLYGDLDQGDARRLAADTFGDWPRLFNPKRSTLPPVPDPNPEASFVLLADKPGLTQAQVVLGEIGGTFRDSLYASLDVINALMNGLGGRLFDELRSRQGLAYSVYGVWSPKYNYPGVFMAGGETETTQVPALIDGIETELRRLDNELVSSNELTYAKDFVLNSMVFELAPNKSEMLRRLVLYRFHGYPDDFLVQLRSAIEQVNALSIQRAARERIRDESFVILVLGDRAKLEPILRSHFGPDLVHLYPLDR
ncbi:hypothetical protein F1559_004271 [Cyanidiococcus yangmingshanensis]|uniref:Peptidase M16 C-terminal domain-containing protein n=1 Tax=Cyanidiococcus yangmingshanensis TaxID=2690220 RepID=A0A7J7INV6_9RHOD|nr:hypothetical protein F1559_004271 [Cyanidiococcus yangmingshanensis]